MSPWNSQEAVREELFGVERLEDHVRSLAAAQPITSKPAKVLPLARRLADNGAVLIHAYRTIVETINDGGSITPAAQWLIDNKVTSSDKLAIRGGSNGGLLVGAALTQRPELFAAAVPAVGVMDMLRYHRFTIGWAWVSEYGSADDPAQFKTLMAYSPLHNLKPGTKYPATLVTTGDHDDRVVPGHSLKFAAALQAAQAGESPVLIRIETRAGHGGSTPTTKLIEQAADVFAFLTAVLKMPGE